MHAPYHNYDLNLNPLVRDRAPVVSRIDEDGDGATDLYCYDVNADGTPDITHRVRDRVTIVDLQRESPYRIPPTATMYTGEPGEPSLRVTYRQPRIDATRHEVNGCPSVACVESHGMLSIGQLWDADREHRDEVWYGRSLWMNHGGAGALEAVDAGKAGVR